MAILTGSFQLQLSVLALGGNRGRGEVILFCCWLASRTRCVRADLCHQTNELNIMYAGTARVCSADTSSRNEVHIYVLQMRQPFAMIDLYNPGTLVPVTMDAYLLKGKICR